MSKNRSVAFRESKRGKLRSLPEQSMVKNMIAAGKTMPIKPRVTTASPANAYIHSNAFGL